MIANSKKTGQIRRRVTGQGMTEYIIIVALIAIAAIVTVTAFGGVVKAQFGAMAASLAGGAPTTAVKAATDQGKAAVTAGTATTTLSTYAQ